MFKVPIDQSPSQRAVHLLEKVSLSLFVRKKKEFTRKKKKILPINKVER